MAGGERMSEIKLKPCPFCGKEAHIIESYCKDTNFRGYYVHHTCLRFMSSLRTGSFDTEKEAAREWNTRLHKDGG